MTDTRDSFVNVKPVIVADAPDAHQVWLDIGVQHFTVGEYCETKDDAEWLAAQLRIALTALQAGAGDGGRYRKLVATGSFTPALNPERTPWGLRMSGTPATKKELDDAVDSCNAQATEEK